MQAGSRDMMWSWQKKTWKTNDKSSKNDTMTQLTHVAKNSGKLLRECWKWNPQLKK